VDVAGRVLERLDRPDLLVPSPFRNDPGRAPRPKHCALSSEKLAAAIGPLAGWREALDDYLDRVLPQPAPE
jgi:dTDP-4-dehydrorhamnose reductase